MPIDAPRAPAPSPQPGGPAGPVITASGQEVLVSGTGFLPHHVVAIRITYADNDIVDYLTYTTDADGCLNAPLPATAVAGTGHLSATDRRPNTDGECGLLWSNTVTVTGESHRLQRTDQSGAARPDSQGAR